MSSSLIQTVNTSNQSVDVNGIINLGSVVRRFGQNCNLVGNSLVLDGCGYYGILATITVEPTAIGNVTVVMNENGNQIAGGIASGYASVAETPVTLPIIGTIRKGCQCTGLSNITFVLTEGAGNVTNIITKAYKE